MKKCINKIKVVSICLLFGLTVSVPVISGDIVSEAFTEMEGYNDCSEGVPDFSETQFGSDNERCGPCCLANILFWFDSKYEDVKGSECNLVFGYDGYDDHDPYSARELIEELSGSRYCDIDGFPAGGVMPIRLEYALEKWIEDRGYDVGVDYDVYYTEDISPTDIKGYISSSNKAVILVTWGYKDGLWDKWGHYLTVQGARVAGDTKIMVSDPVLDGDIISPGDIPGHNDADNVSHDEYDMIKYPIGSNYKILDWYNGEYTLKVTKALIMEEL